MKNIKRVLIAATLLLSLVGGAGQASANPTTPPAPATITLTPSSAGVTSNGFGLSLDMGVTWED